MTEKCCKTCKWYDDLDGVCYNGESENRAKFMDEFDSCEEWEGERVNRKEFLSAAEKCVCNGKGNEYGTLEDNFGLIARLWTVYLGCPISDVDAAIMMNLLKIARIKTGVNKEDSFVDAIGYMACAGELAETEV